MVMIDGDLRDTPIQDGEVTPYDRAHMQAYLRLLDAAAAHADWREAAALVLGLDVEADAQRARRIHDIHLERARWMASAGYRHILKGRPAG
ncbi:DNA -binding domain-containing protein [Caulobacter segnis]|uniref:DNA -binding domain-containing protein n=1 Tax=Caulobacter segnis TaxID=88688 RepID=UPI00285668B7|nr:DUF2285 domain-containing protein [Caulobacter segnis]MDR6624497.1 hypothetical protein [Caulobacter segnis]